MADQEVVCAAMIDPARCLMRGEITSAIDSFRREIEGVRRQDAEYRTRIEFKLDQLLTSKAVEAEQMGAIREQIRGLAETVRQQGGEIGALREKVEAAKEAPKDQLLRFFMEVAKLIGSGVIGYVIARYKI